jgi:hypothetical protein
VDAPFQDEVPSLGLKFEVMYRTVMRLAYRPLMRYTYRPLMRFAVPPLSAARVLLRFNVRRDAYIETFEQVPLWVIGQRMPESSTFGREESLFLPPPNRPLHGVDAVSRQWR